MDKLPQYQSHKKVWAGKITKIKLLNTYTMLVLGEIGERVIVSRGYMVKHQPQVGGYFVRYEGGYDSYSPAEVFESGYTKVN